MKSLATIPLLLLPIALLAQQPAFEVATIKLSAPEEPGFGLSFTGHRLRTTNTRVSDLIAFAWAIHPDQITGGPGWLRSAKYDLVAVAGEASPSDTDAMRLMVQRLLADRLALTFHRDEKELSIYELSSARTGPKLAGDEADPDGKPSYGFEGLGAMTVKNGNMANFANWLQRYVVNRPVSDRTSITGRYNFRLDWRPDEFQFRDRSGLPALPESAERPDLYTALQQQLGLQLKAARAPVEVFVIDHVEKPTEN